uniref:dnaJ homolog subfamily C member 5G isoform X1 n=1 Tax=Callithrix jacchus TaxID=9483 RepID=UPI00159E79A8|nr:dnaJ homolog subfamily C member 5G isoform X1 [Callithrix jacchus]
MFPLPQLSRPHRERERRGRPRAKSEQPGDPRAPRRAAGPPEWSELQRLWRGESELQIPLPPEPRPAWGELPKPRLQAPRPLPMPKPRPHRQSPFPRARARWGRRERPATRVLENSSSPQPRPLGELAPPLHKAPPTGSQLAPQAQGPHDQSSPNDHHLVHARTGVLPTVPSPCGSSTHAEAETVVPITYLRRTRKNVRSSLCCSGWNAVVPT